MNLDRAPQRPANAAEGRLLFGRLMSQVRLCLAESSGLGRHVAPQEPRLVLDDWGDLWDTVYFRAPDDSKRETTEWPHLTLALQPEYVNLQLTLPNAAPSAFWARLRYAEQSQWLAVLKQVEEGMTGLCGAAPPDQWLELKQRHFYARRWVFEDGLLSIKVEVLTGFGDAGVKPVPAWLAALQALLRAKGQANFQFQVQARFAYGDSPCADSTHFAAMLAAAAEHFAPLYALMTGAAQSGSIDPQPSVVA